MNHYYHCKETHNLVLRYEVMLKDGQDINLPELDFFRLMSFYEEEGSFPKALEIVDQALSLFKFSPKLHTQKAKLLIACNNGELALESLDRAEVFGQSFIETDLLRARAYLRMDDYSTALNILTELKLNYFTSPSESSRIYVTEALIYERQEEFERMFLALRDALKEDPFSQEALERMWLAVELAKKHRESVELHEWLIDENPYAYQAWYNLAHAQYFLCNFEEALEAFEYTFLINKRFEPAYKDYTEVCFHLQRYQMALEALEEALNIFDADDELLLKIGECHIKLGNTAKAKIYLYRALTLNKKADEIYFQLAECYVLEKEYRSAIHFYKQAIRLDELREDYLMRLAQAYVSEGRYQKALPLFRRATELGPELSANWVAYTRFLLSLDGIEEALEVIEEAEENAYSSEVLFCKAAIMLKCENRFQAIELLAEALQEDGADKALFFELAPEVQGDKQFDAVFRYYEIEA